MRSRIAHKIIIRFTANKERAAGRQEHAAAVACHACMHGMHGMVGGGGGSFAAEFVAHFPR
jgi:hypothetical protein